MAEETGRRLDNPLGALSSYTYQISLYMVSPTAYDTFTSTGRTKIVALQNIEGSIEGAGSAFLIAQSGGINNETQSRANGFTKDVYIDNLLIEHKVGAQATQSATSTYNVTFDITEPYSFSFTNNLRRASNAIIESEGDRFTNGVLIEGSRQFFILGVKFLGYDENGNIASGKEVTMEDGQPIDAAATGDFMFETFYDIVITGIKFSIDGGATQYKIQAKNPSSTKAFGTKDGRLKGDYTVVGSTLQEMYNGERGLFTQLNKFEQSLTEGGDKALQEYANKYVIEFIGDDAGVLRDASMLNPSDLDKSTWAQLKPNAQSPATDQQGAVSNPSNSKREFKFKEGEPIISTFDMLIKTSSYMKNALQVLYQNKVGPNLESGKPEQTEGSSQQRIAWYRITPVISDLKWDSLKNDWACTMTYRVETYQTPIVNVGATNPGTDYYGPHKRYEYWWTGQNKEILDYKQNLDFLFYNETIGNVSKNDNSADKSVNVSTAIQKTEQSKDGSVGSSQSIENAYITSLYSPDSFAKAKITLFGDPDYLVSDFRGGPNEPYQRFYGDDGFRINANGGQVFIEIDFKEALDYNNGSQSQIYLDQYNITTSNTGVLDINESILFFKYPDWIANQIKGVAYTIVDIKSKFLGGKFTQILDCVLASFPPNPPDAPSTNSAASVGLGQEEDSGEGREPPIPPPGIRGGLSGNLPFGA